jgi:hypothetical protein
LDYDLWSEIVKKKAGYKCEVCGSTENLQSHHIIGRGNWRLRWEPRNGACLCAKHHKFDRNQSAHNNPLWFNEWLQKYRKEDIEWLRKHEMETKSWKKFEKEELRKILSEVIQWNDKKKIAKFTLPLDENCNLS